MCLALLGLGGGVALALWSFNSSESSPRIAGVPREIIYVPPTSSPSLDNTLGAGANNAAALLPPATGANKNLLSSLQAVTAADTFLPAETSDVANPGLGRHNFDKSPGQSFAALEASDLTSTGSVFAATNAAAMEAALSGVAAPVPEASTWAMMLSGAGVLLAVLRRRNRP